jgi:hypothetical protein
MTQEEKDLLYKDLCARIPYSLIVSCTDDDGTMPNVWEVAYINKFKDAYLLNTESTATQLISIEEVKPYLYPMSSMNEELREEYKDLLDNDGYSLDANDNVFTLQDFYCKYHFDYRGLIEKDLALKAPDGMYN